MEAFCLHPLLQSDDDLATFCSENGLLGNWPKGQWKGRVLILAMEYRRIANAYLSTRVIETIDEIKLSVLPEVQEMLVADKVQNRKDFERYHGKHPRFVELTAYFRNWLLKLGVSEAEYQQLIEGIEDRC